MMYGVYCCLIGFFIYLAPALAFFPKLITDARSAFAIPIVSALIVYISTSLVQHLNIFNPITVTVLVAMSAMVAAIRVPATLRTTSVYWPKWQRSGYLLMALVCLPFFAKLGSHAFDRGDEIYSWNFWAIQHYFSEPIDFSHTGAPYPQLFPKLLAFCYALLGSTELQLPVKGMLIVFPWAMLTAIFSCLQMHWSRILSFLVALFYVLFISGLAQFFDDGYADPIMCSALIVSIVLMWQSSTAQNNQTKKWCLSALCAITAAYSKQAALLWLLFSMPILFLWEFKKTKDRNFLYFTATIILAGVLWIIGEGRQFHQNQGVLWLSIENRTLLNQFIYSVNKYLIEQPSLLLLFAMATYYSWHSRWLRAVYWLFLVPGVCCWFLFGAYQLRLGQHLIALALFLIIAGGFDLGTLKWQMYWQKILVWSAWRKQGLFRFGFAISLIVASTLFIKELWVVKHGLSIYHGSQQALHRYFKQDLPYVSRHLFTDPKTLVWVPSRYLYGLFYRHADLTTPDYLLYPSYEISQLSDELIRKKPSYVFTVAPEIIDGTANHLLQQLITQCPLSFKQVTSGGHKHNFVAYQVDVNKLTCDPCLLALSKEISIQTEIAFEE